MKGTIVLIIPALALAIASTSGAQTYSTSLLYTLPLQLGLDQPMPSGLDNPIFDGMTADQTVGRGFDSSNNEHAVLWSASGAVDLSPSGYGESVATAAAAGQQVGGAVDIETGNFHAILWNGTAASAQDLNPASLGAVASAVFGTNGSQQVGFLENSSDLNPQAVLWNGTASSAVNLNPTSISGLIGSEAYATDGGQQVGTLLFPTTIQLRPNITHAVLWGGTAASAVDLNPSGITNALESQALGVAGNQEVGYGDNEGGGVGDPYYSDALLWTGTAASAVDLNPAGAENGEALATNGTQQVGWVADADGNDLATLWSGTAASAVNLQSLLPSSYNWISSEAMAIDSSGDIFGYAQSGRSGYPYDYAVEWTVVPEPASGSLVLLAGAAGLMRRRAKRAA